MSAKWPFPSLYFWGGLCLEFPVFLGWYLPGNATEVCKRGATGAVALGWSVPPCGVNWAEPLVSEGGSQRLVAPMEELCSPGPHVKSMWILGLMKQTNKMELLNNVIQMKIKTLTALHILLVVNLQKAPKFGLLYPVLLIFQLWTFHKVFELFDCLLRYIKFRCKKFTALLKKGSDLLCWT